MPRSKAVPFTGRTSACQAFRSSMIWSLCTSPCLELAAAWLPCRGPQKHLPGSPQWVRQGVEPGAEDRYTATAIAGLKSKHLQSQQEQLLQVFGMTSPKSDLKEGRRAELWWPIRRTPCWFWDTTPRKKLGRTCGKADRPGLLVPIGAIDTYSNSVHSKIPT